MPDQAPVARVDVRPETPGSRQVLQRSAGNHALAAALQRSAVTGVLRSAGQPLPDPVRADMEARLGADFSSVRLHTGAAAQRSAAQVGARAYTSGEHVVLGPGAGDRHTLAHELTHVIQQRQGPVAGTADASGLSISDPSDRFEREAEANASRALQRRPVDAPAPPPSDRRPGTDLAIQRKVGLEFETGWMVRHRTRTDRLLRRPGTSLPKKAPIRPRFPFKVEADEASGGQSEVEFIVDPPIEEGAAGLTQLTQVMNRITQLGDSMRRSAIGGRNPVPDAPLGGPPNPRARPFAQSEASGRATDSSFWITPPSDDYELKAGAQVTSGLKLGSVERLNTAFANPPAANGQATPDTTLPRELQATARILANRAAGVVGTAMPVPPGQELRGLVAIAATYIAKGAVGSKSYPKQIGDLLLARTDFARLFRLLPFQERQPYLQNPNLFVTLVLNTANAAPEMVVNGTPLVATDSIIRAGIKDSNSPTGVTVPGLTVGDWLTGIVQADDRLNRLPDAESMGEFGNRVEEIGLQQNQPREQAGIFEFRGAQVAKIPLSRWSGFAQEFHAYITRLHS